MDITQRILNVEALTSHGNVRGRQAMAQILEAGLRAADPYNNMRALMRLEENRLIFGHPDFFVPGDPTQGDEIIDLDEVDRILVFGAGKGIQRVARAVEDVLGDRLTGGHVIDKHGGPLILERIGVTFGAHPVPDEGCVRGCERILEMAHGLTERDLVITMTANGVSSLLTLPAPGVSLEDVRQMTHLMQIQRGAPTGDLNPVRSHLDQMKGGRLSRHIQPARAIHIAAWICQPWERLMHRNGFLHNLPEETTFEMAVANLKKWNAWDDVAPSVREFLLRADPAQETVRADEFQRMRSRVFCTMPTHLGMLPTARWKAEELGFQAHILYDNSSFEAAPGGLMGAAIAATIEAKGEPLQPPCALFGGGEMIVTVGQENGMGGRNQEWALSAARRIAGSERIVMASVDSDGTDGPGHQFNAEYGDVPVLDGGIVDGYTLGDARAQGWDVDAELRRHNTSPILHSLGCGVIASHNISMNDLTVILVLD
jgi:glycerate 2-kinase